MIEKGTRYLLKSNMNKWNDFRERKNIVVEDYIKMK